MTIIANRFELGRVAGKGGMATVHEARDQATGRTVALKIVEGDFANARFEREAGLLARLCHPGIVGYVAHGCIDNQRMYLAMEWLEGVPLDAHVAKGPLSLGDTLALGARIARSLASAHEAGVVHRDVKPSNIILRGGRAEDAILVDFGIARTDDASRAMTATGAVVGTPTYMAPEQVRGAGKVDARADMFSLGCVLFECLTGHAPFTGEHVLAVLAKILLEPAPRAASARPDVPRALDDLIDALLEKSPEARPSTMEHVAMVLEGISSSDDVVASAQRRGAIGLVEQRLATVLLARRSPRQAPLEGALADTEDALAGITVEGLVSAVAHLGISVTELADGALVGMVATEHVGADAAARVVRCALLLEQELRGAGIAVATGRTVVAGIVPVGEAIDVAAGLLATVGSPEGVWICPATRAMVEPLFETSEHASTTRVLRARRSEERMRTLLGKATPCVGRDRELAMLEATLEECIDEPIARACLVIAPPGIGKSRLQRELVARVQSRGRDIARFIGVADPLMAAAPYAFASDLMRRVFGIVEDEPLESRRRKISDHLAAIGVPQADKVARRLGEISGTPFDDREDDALRAARRDPLLLAAQATDAFVAFILAEVSRRPHLIVLEDVHWSDAASMRLVGAALARASDLPLMVLALARPTVDEVFPKLWEEQRCQRVVLEPLLKKAAERLARVVLGDDADVQAIVRRAGGNALFVEELARACAEGRAPSELPPTIAAVTEARLTSLPPDARRALRAAAVFGERFWAGGLAALIGAREAAHLDHTLLFLEERELVSPTAISRFGHAEREYVFRHAIVRDVAYEMLAPEDRRLGHALAAAWLEDRLDDGALLAHHFEAGDRSAEAARWYVRAAEQALAAHDFDALFRHAQRAEVCGAQGALLGSARLAEADARVWLGDNAAAGHAGLAALDALDEASTKWFTALGLGLTATGRLGDVAALLALVDRLLTATAVDEASGRARAIARARAAIQLAYSGEIARADELLDRWEEDPAAADPLVLAWMYEALAERGNAAGQPIHPSLIRRGRDLRFQLGDQRGAFAQWGVELQLLSSLGVFDEAIAMADELAGAVGDTSPIIGLYVAMIHAVAAGAKGDCEPLAKVARRVDAGQWPRAATNALATLSQLLLSAGRSDEARVSAEAAMAVAGGPRCYQTNALAVLARLEVAAGNVAAAMEMSERALLYSQSGVSMHAVAVVHLARVEALDADGRVAEAREALQAGVDSLWTRSRNVVDYRPHLFALSDNAALLRLAHERGVEAREAPPTPAKPSHTTST